ncbi:MAG TPA: ABC transporter substrate-binding protein [Candidatus Binatia bacterium]|nr:ABC transporter substrate-binding protein [Candidatus Binatia bacterium]
MNRLIAVGLLAVFVTAPSLAEAQSPSKLRTIGYLTQATGPGAAYQIFRQELRNVGYVEGKTIEIEYRSAEIQPHLDKAAASLLSKKVEVIVTIGGRALRTLQNATKTVPIVFTLSGDPIESGFVESLARPGANLTGITWMAFELAGKRLELLKEAAPKVSRVAVLTNPTHPGEYRESQEARKTARSLGMTLLYHRVRDKIEYDFAFNDIPSEKADGLLVFPEEKSMEHGQQIADFAIKRRLPSMFGWREYVEAGGLIAYGPNRAESLRRIAVYVDKILKGAKPKDLPVERPTRFELVINLRIAKQIGLTITPNVLARADKVIR